MSMLIRHIDVVAFLGAIAAAGTSFVILTAIKPMPPRIPRAPRQKTGFLAWLLDQAYDRTCCPPLQSDYFIFSKTNYRAAAYRHFCFQIIGLAHPADLEHVFLTNKNNYVKGMGYDAIKRMFGNGLVTVADGEEHTRHRRIVSPAFSPAALKLMSKETMVTHAKELYTEIYRRVDEGAVDVALQELISRAALNIVADAAFHTGKEELGQVSDHIMRMQEEGISFLSFIPILDKLPSKSFELLQAFRSMVNDIILRRYQTREEQGTGEGRAIIDYLVRSKELDFSMLKDHSVTFMFAGFETSSTCLQWTLLNLARDESIQQKLFEELSAAFGPRICPDPDLLRLCPFLVNVIKESLRLFPPVVGLPRQAIADDVLPYSKVVIPAGAFVDCAFAATHLEPSTYGADAAAFRPERWEDPSLEQRIGSCGFIPFSAGPRNCIGKDFAWNEILMLLSLLVRNFRFSFPAGESFPDQKRGIVIYPAPYRLGIALRAEN
jgi:cytochrome P450